MTRSQILELVGRCVAEFPDDLKHQRESYVVTIASRDTAATAANKQEAIDILRRLLR